MKSSVSPELVVNQNNLLTEESMRSIFVLCLPLQILSEDNTGRERINHFDMLIDWHQFTYLAHACFLNK